MVILQTNASYCCEACGAATSATSQSSMISSSPAVSWCFSSCYWSAATAVFIISDHHVPCITCVASDEFSAKDSSRNTAAPRAWLTPSDCRLWVVWEWEPARIWMLPTELVWCWCWASDVTASVARWNCAPAGRPRRRLCKRRQTAWCCMRREARDICRRRVRRNRNSFYIATQLQRPAVYTGWRHCVDNCIFLTRFHILLRHFSTVFARFVHSNKLRGIMLRCTEIEGTSWSSLFCLTNEDIITVSSYHSQKVSDCKEK